MWSKSSSKCLFIVAVPQTSGPYFLTTRTLQISLSHKSVKLGCPVSAVVFIQFSHVRLFETPWDAAPRLPCPSPTPGACSNSCPSRRWCHPTISSSAVPFSSHLRSFSASGSFPMSHIRWPKYWSFSFNISPSNEHPGSPLAWTGWISLQSKGLSRFFPY